MTLYTSVRSYLEETTTALLEEERPRPPGQVVVLVPAHNEQEAIASTIASLHRQTRPADRIIVCCDNCTDDTEAIIEPLDCEKFCSVGNTHKKAGVLNQAYLMLADELADNDRVLVMDADTELAVDFIELALAALAGDDANDQLPSKDNPKVGAVSAAYVGKNKPGLIPTLQRMEYVQERRRVARNKGRVTCLSGTAALFTMACLRDLVYNRGYAVPGQKTKQVPYLWVSLTEDFEITLALKTLGYQPISPKECIAYTDVMETPKMLWSQRIRWQRGTLETLRLYKLTRLTWHLYFVQLYTYLISLATPFMFLLWALSVLVLGTGLRMNTYIVILLPLSSVEQMLATRRLRSWKVTIMAGLLLPLWLYDNYRAIIYWSAALQLLKRTEFAWE